MNFYIPAVAGRVPSGVDVLLFKVLVAALVLLGQQHAAFNIHQARGHDKELAGYFEVEFFHRAEDVDILPGDGLNWNIVDVDFVAAYQVEQQVQRPFEGGKLRMAKSLAGASASSMACGYSASKRSAILNSTSLSRCA